MLFRYDRDPANPLRVPPLRRSLDPRAIAIFIVDNAHGKFLYGINTAISDNRDEWNSLLQEIICRLEGVLSGSRCNLYDPLFLFFITPDTTHIYTLSLHDALPISGRQRT